MADGAVKSEPQADLGGSGGSSQLPGFPSGLRVLVVDDDPTCLMVVSAMLKKCNYEVTTSINGMSALEELRQHPNHYDLVLSDVYMPDMDGFKLLEHIGLELDLPVIMMSSNGETNVVLRGVTHGAVDFLIKPVRIEELRNAWQHVVRRRRESAISKDSEEDHDDEAAKRHDKKRKSDERRKSGEHSDGEGNSAKKARVVWSVEMHQQFVNAVNTLGVDKAVPKRILDLMNVEGLTRENVASHLQKYRLYLKRVSGVAPAGPSGRGSGGKGMRLPGMPGVGHGAAVAANAAPGAMPDVMAAAGQSPPAPGADASGAGAAAAGQGAPLGGFASPPMGMQQAPLLQPGGPGAVPDHIMRMQLQTLQMQAMSLGVGGGLPGAMPGSSAPMMAGGMAAPGMQGIGSGAAPPAGFPVPGGMGMAGMPGLPPGLEYGMPPPGAFTGDMSWANLAGQPGFAGDHGHTGLLAHSTPAANASLQTASQLPGDAQLQQQQPQQAQPTQQQQAQPQQHASPPLQRDPRQQPQQQQLPQQHSAMQHQPLQAPGHGLQHTPQSLQLSFEPHQQQMAAAVGQYPGLPFGPMGPPMGHMPGYPPPVPPPLQPFQPHMQPQSQPMTVGRLPDGGASSGVPVPAEDPSSMDDILNYFLKDAAATE